MLDFLKICTRAPKKTLIEIYPSFKLYPKSTDLMTKGSDFYAVWVEDENRWSTDEQDALRLIDKELDKFVEENKDKFECRYKVLRMQQSDSKMINTWHDYVKHQLRDSYHELDDKLIFSNMEVKKRDYSSKKLPYPLEEGDYSNYDRLMSVLYSEEERHKIEWAIGAIVSGDSKKIQKFVVLYGAAGTGKSTVIDIIEMLFQGYYAVFDAKAIGSANSVFALESLRSNPLVAIQHDGDLSRIEDNTRLNSLVAHEIMTVNEKFKTTYGTRFRSFLFLGSNKPVKITDSKSGLIRRLIDVEPSGNILPRKEYDKIKAAIPFELGAIAKHCLDVYLEKPNAYDKYTPITMLGATNDFYNFVSEYYFKFSKEDGTSLSDAWELYDKYVKDARVQYPLSMKGFKEELRTYFKEFKERATNSNGQRVRNLYSGFRKERFERNKDEEEEEKKPAIPKWLDLTFTVSLLDKDLGDCQAQYANEAGTPLTSWARCKTKLSELDTTKLHYVRPPEYHIVIDFDLKDETGKKSRELNLLAASKWKKTYAEYSKSGAGIHLHYIYKGDISLLSSVFDENIEVKVFQGNSSLRRRLSFCNNVNIATISSGLPLREKKKMTDFKGFETEKALSTFILRCLNKEYEPHHTKPSIDYISNALDECYEKGLHYDVSRFKTAITALAMSSSNNSDYCMAKVNKMKFKSEEPSDSNDVSAGDQIVFFDVEVFPNLFLLNWKFQGEGQTVNRMINPSPDDIRAIMGFKLIGFNCRRYDNHIVWAAMLGFTPIKLFELSQRIITKGDKNAFFSEAYNLSYTDIYDFASTKQSLKKWEIELGILHKELGLPWDQPVPEEMWERVAEYCDNDVLATEAVFNHLQSDFSAREILAKITGGSVNDTTNSLSAKFIFGKDKKPQSQFNYRNLGDEAKISDKVTKEKLDIFKEKTGYDLDPEFTKFDENGRPVFPGYSYEAGVSTYRGVEIGEGGRVYANPGIYNDVALLDIASMHPSSIEAEELFGPVYTKRFSELKRARVHIKHGDYDAAKKLLNGVLAQFIDAEGFNPDGLAQALKIVINAVYGLTAAKFDNPFRDIRNVDNIVAKRGALFMENLLHEVENRYMPAAHIKTDSIKIPDANLDIIEFVKEYGRLYGYEFEHEATYDRMCLVNDAVYIAKYASIELCYLLYGKEYVDAGKDILKDNKKHPRKWTATGTQFQVPFVFKTLFSHEPIEFKDLCEAKSVSTALYLKQDDSDPEFIGKVGLFCPIKKENGGKELLRESKDKEGNQKFDAATGTKGYYWLEAEYVKALEKENDIDRSYYIKMVDEAKDTINKFGDFEAFVADDIPPWELPCGIKDNHFCSKCTKFHMYESGPVCDDGYDIQDTLY